MKKIALVCDSNVGTAERASPDDKVLIKIINAWPNIKVELIIWDQYPIEKLNNFEALVIRSTWDYHLKPIAFMEWLKKAEKMTTIYNSPDIIRWNCKKTYLSELEQNGVPIIPTLFVENIFDNAEINTIIPIIESKNYTEIVIKPSVSASAYNTEKLETKNLRVEIAKLRTKLQTTNIVDKIAHSFMIQPFIPSVTTIGEFSHIIINNKFSFAIMKKTATGDFRVQNGNRELMIPTPEQVEFSEKVMKGLGKNVLYARVDFLEHEGKFLLMELELIEPYLYLTYSQKGIEEFAKAIYQLIHSENK